MTRRDEIHVVVDAAALEAPDTRTAATLAEQLEHGTASEVREALTTVGLLIRHGRPLPADVAAYVGAALERVGGGDDPRHAFRLTTKKKHGVRYHKAVNYLIADLRRQGLTRDEAEAVTAQFDMDRLGLRKMVGNELARLRQRLRRTPTK